MSLKSITGYREFESDSLHDGAESYNVSTLVAGSAEQDQFSLYDSVWATDATPEKDYCAGLRAKFGKK